MKLTSIWILTSSYNDYDQHGDYFENVWWDKPKIEDLIKATEENTKGLGVHELLCKMVELERDGKTRVGDHVEYDLKLHKISSKEKN